MLRRIAILLAIVTGSAAPLSAQELSKEQMGPWSALNTQVSLFLKRDWDEHEKYIHPQAIIAGDDLPAPVTDKRLIKYTKIMFDNSEKVLAHYLTPVTVTVAGDVAIINAYAQVLTEKDGERTESTYRLHNTWKKDDGRWRLLSTYNATVKQDELDDD